MAEKFQYTAIQELDLIKANKIKLIEKINELFGYDTQLTWTSTWGELQAKIGELKTLLPEQDEEIHDELEAFLSNSSINNIKIASETINDYSFFGKTSLVSIDAPIATSIGESAFYGCTGLTSIDANLVTTIGDNAFVGCRGLTSIAFPLVTSIEPSALGGANNLTTIDLSSLSSLVYDLFSSKSKLTMLSIDYSAITSIPARCFSDCSRLELDETTFPNVVTIYDNAFQNCYKLTNWDWAKPTLIGSYAFSGCTGLTGELDLTNCKATINKYAFANCSGLSDVVIGENIGTLYQYIFNDTSFPIYCELESQPSSWDGNWSNGHTVYWNAKKRDYTFVLDNGSEDIVKNLRVVRDTDLPEITKSGYLFNAWFLDSDFTNALSTPYLSADQCTFYAKWSRQVKLIAVNIEKEYTETDLGIYAYNNITEMPNVIFPYQCLGYYSSYDSSTHTFADIVADIDSLVGDIPVVYIKACNDPNEPVDLSFSYVESAQEAVLMPGSYTFYCWGAQGLCHKSMTDTTSNYYGGFASGKIKLNSQQTFYIYTGGKPGQNGQDVYTGGWNGGGGSYKSSNYNDNAPGGGATDICLVKSDVVLDNYKRYVRSSASYLSRLLVAGGGGGGRSSSGSATFGGYCPAATTSSGQWGSLTSAGTNTGTYYVSGDFGYGASGTNTYDDTAGGGGGWYGGGCQGDSYGGGGSSFAWTSDYAGYVPTGYSVSTELYLTEPVFLYGSAQQPTFSDVDTTAAGHTGNGCARIIGMAAREPSDIPAKVVTIIGIGPDSTQHEIYTTSILHNLYQSDLPETIIGWIITSDYYLDETLSSQLTLPYNIDFDNEILYLYCTVEENPVTDFEYSGESKTGTLSVGTYKLECWGAQGGSSWNNSHAGGKGGYSYGTLTLTTTTQFIATVGGAGSMSVNSNTKAIGGFNGGGDTGIGNSSDITTTAGSGGGGTDIRLNTDSLYARVIVAGGGGGGGYNGNGGAGGGASGIRAGTNDRDSYAGTATSGGGIAPTSDPGITAGTFGCGGTGGNYGSSGGAGGGGGWYGAGGAGGGFPNVGRAAGGSGYVYTSDTAANYPSGCLLTDAYYLAEAATIAGNSTFTSPDGTEETGHAGNGYIRITKIKS